MIDSIRCSQILAEKKCCVIIPTFNNELTLGQVIEDVSLYTNDVVIVNDGSTDGTLEILKKYSSHQITGYTHNVGKGFALRTAFKYAIDRGYQYAITIDSDGQHFAKDIPAFAEKLLEVPDAVIIGARNMDQASIPGKSSFGHKFSNFWFKVETGLEAPDTQSGFRLYPLHLLRDFTFYTNKYEFEIEVIVRAAWKGIKIDSVPVQVYYAPKETRVSHFRPFKDFTRVSLLNTVLVTLTIIYYGPVRIFKSLKKKNLRQIIRDGIFNASESNFKKALAIGFGVFMGIVPVWGYQIMLAVFLAHVFKLNKVLTVLASNISIPPMVPFILYFSYMTGGWVIGGDTKSTLSEMTNFSNLGKNLSQYIVGSFCLATFCAVCSVGIAWGFLEIFNKKRNKST